jgi:hypothetical protein
MIRLSIPFVLLIIGWIAFVILLRRDEDKVQSEWVALLSPASERIFQEARADIEANTIRVEVAVNEAIEIRQLGDLDEAIRFLNLGGDIIQRFTPNLLSLLSVMMRFSRMIGAIAPVNPILPQGFHLAELTSLAHLNGMLHRVLTSAKQRFRLKLYILGKGVSITSQYLVKRIRSVVAHRSSEDSEWEQILGVEQDFRGFLASRFRASRTYSRRFPTMASENSREHWGSLHLFLRKGRPLKQPWAWSNTAKPVLFDTAIDLSGA